MKRYQPDVVQASRSISMALSSRPNWLTIWASILFWAAGFRDPAKEPGGFAVAMISHALWQRLGGRPDILGEALTLDGRKYTILGVMPGWFHLPVGGPGAPREQVRSDVWIPLDPRVEAQDRVSGLYLAYARLKPDVTLAAAIADVKAAASGIAKEDPQAHPVVYGPAG